MTKLENDILLALKEDARLNPSKIALMLGESEEVIVSTIKSLEKSGVIVKYTTIVDPDAVDDGEVEALIEVKVTPQKGSGFDAIAQEIASHPQVKNLYLMSGSYDIMVIITGKSLKSISRFVSERISTYDNVLSTATHFILKKYKVEGAEMSGERLSPRESVQP